MDTLFPVILSVPQKKQQLKGRERVAFLSRLARCAVERSSQKTGSPIGCLKKDGKGAPIPSGVVHWSISHKPEYVIGVVSPIKIGIDIEKFRPYSQGLEKKVADLQEWELSNSDRSELLFRYWTAKEAVLKSEGMGLSGLSACKVVKVIDKTNLIVSFQNKNRVIEHYFFKNHVAAIVKDQYRVEWTVEKITNSFSGSLLV
jgi:4'-phosphopantetheinyl transferase